MFEMYTEGARRVMFFARYEASRLGSPAIEPEHLFLGILREGGAAAGYLVANGFDLLELRRRVEAIFTAEGPISTSVDIPLSASSKEVLAMASEEGWSHPMGSVGVQEILVAIHREGRNAGARLLAEGRFDAAALRASGRPALGPWPCRRCGQMLSPAVVEPTLRVRLDETRSAPRPVSIAASVCAGCGLVELVVEDPARLRDR